MSRQKEKIIEMFNGIELLRQFSSLLINKYEFEFRRFHSDEYMREVSAMPFLVLLREPKTFKKDLRPAFEYSLYAAKASRQSLNTKIAKTNMNEQIELFKKAQLSPKDTAHLGDNLKIFFEFESIAKYFSFNQDLKDPVLYNKILGEYNSGEARLKLAGAAGILALTGLCLMPAAGSAAKAVVAPTTKLALVLFGSRETVSFFRSVEFKSLCWTAILAPVQIYQTLHGYSRLQELHDLFFSSADNRSLFVSYQQLNTQHREALLNLFMLPVDATILATMLKGLPFMNEILFKKVTDYFAK